MSNSKNDKQKQFVLVISTKKVKIYWNMILGRWVDYLANASRFSEEDLRDYDLPFAVTIQEVAE
jgi:hypothetical protein